MLNVLEGLLFQAKYLNAGDKLHELGMVKAVLIYCYLLTKQRYNDKKVPFCM